MPATDATWIDRFPALAGLSAAHRRMLAAAVRPLRLPAGVNAFAPGQSAESYLLILEGIVRVQQTSESGREIALPGSAAATAAS